MQLAAAKIHDINLAALAVTGDGLLSELSQLRDHDPLYWSEESQCWIASGHAEVLEGFSGQLPLSSTHIPASLHRVMPPEELNRRLPNAMRYMPHIVTNLDGQAHARIRRLMVKALNRKLVESLRPFVEARVGQLLDLAEAKGQVEFHEEIARMLPGAVILKLLGMDPDRYLARLKGWADGVTTALTSFNPEPEWLDGLEVVVTDMITVFKAEIEDRRANPREDVITAFLTTADDEAHLSMDEMLAALILIIIAGHDTTSNSLTLGVRALAQHPEGWAWWREHPDSRLACTRELLRYIAVSTALPRVVSEDFTWQGRELKQGQMVMLMIAGGDRDPQVNPEPERLDFTRPNYTALTFGPGLHHCIGHILAKLQLGEFFTQLVNRFDRAEIVSPPDFLPILVFRGVSALEVRFS